jgi:hypothetical protein
MEDNTIDIFQIKTKLDKILQKTYPSFDTAISIYGNKKGFEMVLRVINIENKSIFKQLLSVASTEKDTPVFIGFIADVFVKFLKSGLYDLNNCGYYGK